MLKLLAGEPRKKPWGLHPNGDLWVVIARCVEAKGPSSISIKWVKGHSTTQHVQDGVISHDDRLGNTIADELADLGVRKHTDGLCELGFVYAKRRLAYLHTIHSIHNHIVKVSHLFRDLEKKASDRAVVLGHKHDIKPGLADSQGDQSQARNLRPWWPRKSMMPKNDSLFMQVWHFIRLLAVSPRKNLNAVTGQCEQGTSWIELMCLFEIFGGKMHKSELETRFTLRKALTVFKHTVGSVVNLCLSREDAIFFGSSRSPICRLKSVGI
jgi:hypothetical protein